MRQRLARAKAKIRAAGIPFRVPPDEALPERLDAALDVVYLVFNEGYAASAGDAHVRRSLCAEAIRLAAIVAALMPDEPEALGLQALLLAHDARRDTRVDASGALVLLEDQDRSRWDAEAIAEATRLAGARAAARAARPLRPAGGDRRRARQRPDRRRHPPGSHRRPLRPPGRPGARPGRRAQPRGRGRARRRRRRRPRPRRRAGRRPGPLPLLPRRARRPPAPPRRARSRGGRLHARPRTGRQRRRASVSRAPACRSPRGSAGRAGGIARAAAAGGTLPAPWHLAHSNSNFPTGSARPRCSRCSRTA